MPTGQQGSHSGTRYDGGPPSDISPRLDISSLDRSVREFFSASLAQSTAREYASANRRFLAFCNQYNFQPLPVSETLLCRYVSFLASQSLKYQSIKSYLSAVRYLQISHGLHDPFGAGAFPCLEYVLKGIIRSPSAPGSRARLPITPAILRGFLALWSDNNNPDNTMLWAACCLGFFGFLRSGEFTVQSVGATDPPLLQSDIALYSRENPTVVSVKICRSKTDPFRVGVSLYLGITKDFICPVKSLAAYLALRPKEDGPLFLWKEGSALTRDQLVREVKSAVSMIGLDPKSYAGHSFRIGAATTASHVGIPGSTIQMLGRWESSAYLRYIKTPQQQLACISAQLVSQ